MSSSKQPSSQGKYREGAINDVSNPNGYEVQITRAAYPPLPTSRVNFGHLEKGDVAFDFGGESEQEANKWIDIVRNKVMVNQSWGKVLRECKMPNKKAIKFHYSGSIFPWSGFKHSMAGLTSFCLDNGLERRSNSFAIGPKADQGDGPIIFEPIDYLKHIPVKLDHSRAPVPTSEQKRQRPSE
ncbi:MAG: hypothetical protein M1828_004576 [Chrysothrix sp. TS-e1954]|nr:MAG: hypothetical protein M1828_004576 [Chrysothrix sp. TS-e1954]